MNPLRIGTRGSLLAKLQAEYVRKQLFQLDGLEAEIVVIETSGDRLQHSPVTQIGMTPLSLPKRALTAWAGVTASRRRFPPKFVCPPWDGAPSLSRRASLILKWQMFWTSWITRKPVTR